MEMFYLFLITASLLVPEKYSNLEDCKVAGKAAYSIRAQPDNWYSCIPAPKLIASTNTLIIPTYPGYYCGTNDCSLKEK